MERKTVVLVALIVGFIAASYALVWPDLMYEWHLTYEDGWVENVGALAFLAVALIFLLFFIRSKSSIRIYPFFKHFNPIFLMLGLLFFVAFGEEISWGQRLFDWDTPESWKIKNLQGETNIHNLDFFRKKDGSIDEQQGILAEIFTLSPGRLFLYFWMIFLLAIPTLNHFSKRGRDLLRKYHVPVAPFWVGGLMLLNLLFANLITIVVQDHYESNYKTVDEFMEMNYAVILLGLATFWLWEEIYLVKRKVMN